MLIAFSFPPYSRETVEAVKAAASRKIRVVGITDRLTSPVSYSAVFVLPIRSTNMIFTNSISAISVVINALVTEIALKNRSQALRLQKEIGRAAQGSRPLHDGLGLACKRRRLPHEVRALLHRPHDCVDRRSHGREQPARSPVASLTATEAKGSRARTWWSSVPTRALPRILTVPM